MKKSVKYLKIFTNFFVFFVILVTVCLVLPQVIKFFLPFVVGWIIAMIANPLIKFMERKLKIVRKHGTVLIIVLVLALVILAVYAAGINVVRQIVGVVEDIPQIAKAFQNDWKDIQENLSVVYEKIPESVQGELSEIYDNIVISLGDMISNLGAPTVNAVGSFAQNIPSALISMVMAVLSSYFFIADKERIEESVRKYTPESVRKYVKLITKEFKRIVGGYFAAQLKIMCIVMVLLFVGFMILKIKYAVLLAILIAFLDMLPFFGTGTALCPWAVFKLLSGDYTVAVGLLIIYGVTQLVRQLIQPKIVGDTIGLDPLATLVFMYIGYKVSGVLGMIIAIPVGMIIISLYRLGVFDNLIRCINELVNDINEFRKW